VRVDFVLKGRDVHGFREFRTELLDARQGLRVRAELLGAGARAKKGIFITTASFSREAQDYASRIDNKIVLIDGEELAEFMIDNNIGVSPVSNYEVKRIDLDYFSEE